MKRITANITSLVMVVLLLTAASYSQYEQHLVLKVDVPFEFNVGKKTFPAGEYRVVRIAPYTLALRDSKDGFLTSVVTGSVVSFKARSNPKLTFEMENGHYQLSEVWPAAGTTGYQLSLPKRQVGFAQNHVAGTEVQASALSSTRKQ